MRFLRIINSPKWDIVAVVEEEHGQQSCGLLDFFEQLEKSGGFNGSIDGMFALLEHVAPCSLRARRPDSVCRRPG